MLPLIFPILEHLERMLHPPKRHALLVEKKAFYFSKRALRAGAACKKYNTEIYFKQFFICLERTSQFINSIFRTINRKRRSAADL